MGATKDAIVEASDLPVRAPAEPAYHAVIVHALLRVPLSCAVRLSWDMPRWVCPFVCRASLCVPFRVLCVCLGTFRSAFRICSSATKG